MATAGVTRRFLRLRSALAFGLLLAAACAALWVTALGRAHVEKRDIAVSEIDAALISLSQITRSFDSFVWNDGGVHRSVVKSELRSLAAKLEESGEKLRALSAAGGFAPATEALISSPALIPLVQLDEVTAIAKRLADGNPTPEMEERLGDVGVKLTQSLLPTYLRMKETERLASVDAGAAVVRYGWVALFITVAAILAIVRFIHLPMERAIIEAQARSAESRTAAEAASDAKTQFLATMSHEIRTPMNGILGIAELMRTTSPSDDQRRLADVIHESGQSLMSIIDDILDLSKIEAGKVELERRPFDVAGVCDAVRRLFSSRAESKGLNLALDVDPTGRNWVRRGDEKAVRQIISNLVGNAIKFTESGTVTISLTDRADPAVRAVGVPAGRMLAIAVRDEGIGVSPEAQSRIFEEFEQADASTTRTYGGTGLGLSIVRRLTEAMGGEVALKSALGEGAEFTVRLPLERVDETAPETDRASAEPALAPILHKHVLVADDNDMNRTMAVRFLEKAGCRVSEVANGAEAVEMAERLDPDLIFMDGEMPLLDGIEATRAIREGERARRTRPVPIIALSANAKPERRRRALEAGMDGYVAKPFEPDELLEVLATDWSKRRGGAPRRT